MNKKRSKLFEELIVKSWWVILFFLLSFFIYDEGVRRRNVEKKQLHTKLEDLYAEKEKALTLREELKEQIAAQKECAWIELVLMKELGLVPEEERKVLFTQGEKSS